MKETQIEKKKKKKRLSLSPRKIVTNWFLNLLLKVAIVEGTGTADIAVNDILLIRLLSSLTVTFSFSRVPLH